MTMTNGIAIAIACPPTSPNIFTASGTPRIAKFDRQMP